MDTFVVLVGCEVYDFITEVVLGRSFENYHIYKTAPPRIKTKEMFKNLWMHKNDLSILFERRYFTDEDIFNWEASWIHEESLEYTEKFVCKARKDFFDVIGSVHDEKKKTLKPYIAEALDILDDREIGEDEEDDEEDEMDEDEDETVGIWDIRMEEKAIRSDYGLEADKDRTTPGGYAILHYLVRERTMFDADDFARILDLTDNVAITAHMDKVMDFAYNIEWSMDAEEMDCAFSLLEAGCHPSLIGSIVDETDEIGDGLIRVRSAARATVRQKFFFNYFKRSSDHFQKTYMLRHPEIPTSEAMLFYEVFFPKIYPSATLIENTTILDLFEEPLDELPLSYEYLRDDIDSLVEEEEINPELSYEEAFYEDEDDDIDDMKFNECLGDDITILRSDVDLHYFATYFGENTIRSYNFRFIATPFDDSLRILKLTPDFPREEFLENMNIYIYPLIHEDVPYQLDLIYESPFVLTNSYNYFNDHAFRYCNNLYCDWDYFVTPFRSLDLNGVRQLCKDNDLNFLEYYREHILPYLKKTGRK